MNKATISLIILCLVLAGTFGYFYYKYDFTKKEIEYSNISISAEFNNQKVVTSYVIEAINKIEGNTSQSYEKETVQNGIIKIYNKNLENQNFYTDLREINITKNQRITLKLEEPKEIKTEILNKNPIILYLESEDARNIDFCLSWSMNYIFVKTNFTKIDIKNYENLDCYDGNFSLINSNKTIKINYSKFGTPNEDDYIKIILLTDVESKNPKIVKII